MHRCVCIHSADFMWWMHSKAFLQHLTALSSLLCEPYISSLDVDECAMGTHECAQHCSNTVGLYSCSCQDEFNLAPDGKTCIPVCGETFSFPNGTFNTPGWPHFYPELDFKCEWIINVNSTFLDNGTRSVVRFEFNKTAFGLGDASSCSRDYIKFYNGINADAESVVRACGTEAPMSFTVISTEIRVVFQGSSRPHVEGQVGAMVSFFTVEQGTVAVSKHINF